MIERARANLGGGTQAPGSRQTRSPGQASAGVGRGRRRLGPPREGRTNGNPRH